MNRNSTRLPLNSIQAAFFLLSIHNWPATVDVIVFGGICLSPGPSFSGRVGCEGSMFVSIASPGRTNVSVAIVVDMQRRKRRLMSSLRKLSALSVGLISKGSNWR